MSSPFLLANPERSWVPPEAARSFDRSAVEQRIGPCAERLEVLSGGQKNLNLRVGADSVLKIHGEPDLAQKEAQLLTWPWRVFRVPALRASGEDFLWLDYVPHTPLEARPEHARAVGRALAEIHERAMPRAGHLAPDLSVQSPFDDFVGVLTEHALSRFALEALRPIRHWAPLVRRFFDERRAALSEAAGSSVLLHGDFKPSNLHWAGTALLVLDWEFCYAGSRLMDVGQLLRWQPPAEFVSEFSAAYRGAGGVLAPGFEAHAEAFDLVNLLGLLERAAPASRRQRDVTGRIRRTLARAGLAA